MSSLWHNSDILAPAPAEEEEKEEKKKVDVKSKGGGLKNKIKKIGG